MTNSLELHLKIVGFILVVLAFVHIVFPKYFAWKEQLKSLTLINKQLMYVHTFFYCSNYIANGRALYVVR